MRFIPAVSAVRIRAPPPTANEVPLEFFGEELLVYRYKNGVVGSGDVMGELKKQVVIFLSICLGICFLYGIFCLDAYLELGFSEISFTEYTQSFMLFFSSILYAVSIKRVRRCKRALILLSGAFMAMFIREQDKYLDACFWHSAWIIPAYTVIMLAIYFALRDGKRRFLEDLSNFAAWRYCPVVSVGLASLLVYSRLFGSKFAWKMMLKDNGRMVYLSKAAIEESTELFAYTLLFVTALLFFLESRNSDN